MLRQYDRHTKGRKLPVLKVPDWMGWYPQWWMLSRYMNTHKLTAPCTIPVAFKDGKRRKIKRLHIEGLTPIQPGCTCCSPYLELTGRMGGQAVRVNIG